MNRIVTICLLIFLCSVGTLLQAQQATCGNSSFHAIEDFGKQENAFKTQTTLFHFLLINGFKPRLNSSISNSKIFPTLILEVAISRNLKVWVYILGVILTVILVYGLFRYRLYRLEKEKLRLESIVEERTRELAGQAKKLEKYNQIKDEFFAIIAHDLREPMISFQSMSKKIKFLHREGNQNDVDGMLELVDSAAQNINNLLDNLLNWALLQKGIFPYVPAQLKLQEVSNQTIQLYQPIAKAKGIVLRQNISEKVLVQADKDSVCMILRNMISNAIKYSSEGDMVTIDATHKKENVLLHVIDTGTGMSDESRGKIFELGGKKIKRGTKGEKGSGLGLVLCKELVELNNGSIEVKSELKKGTTFSIVYPKK